MIARLAVVADAANTTAGGKLNILGEFNVIFAAHTPFKWPRMFLVLKLETDPGEGGLHKVRIRVIDQDARSVAPELKGEINLGEPFRPGLPLSGPLIFEIREAFFERYGTYEFEVCVGDKVVTRVPIYVVERPRPAQ